MYRQLEKWDGTVRSLSLKSRKPLSHPHSHTDDELSLIKRMLKRNGIYGLAEVYVRCQSQGYTRSFGSMCRQIRQKGYLKPKIKRKSYTRYTQVDGSYPGDKVQVDIKYVPAECIKFPSYGKRYYQITAIDEYSRKRILKIVEEKSSYETAIFLKDLEKELGFAIKTIQVDNGYEFVNNKEASEKLTAFMKVANDKGYEVKRIRPYSPWQNGKVERSHREDGKIFYGRYVFTSKQDLVEKLKKHQNRYNKTAKAVLNFKSPNDIVKEYFEEYKAV